MNIKPLVMRVGERAISDGAIDESPVQQDFLPAVVEVESGIALAKGSRLTEVARETSDDK